MCACERASNSQNQLHLKWLFVGRLSPYQLIPNSPIYSPFTHPHTHLYQLAKSLRLPYPVRLSMQVTVKMAIGPQKCVDISEDMSTCFDIYIYL